MADRQPHGLFMHGKGFVRSFAAILSEATPEGAIEEAENASTGSGKPDSISAYQQTMAHTASCHRVFRFHIISSVY